MLVVLVKGSDSTGCELDGCLVRKMDVMNLS